MTRRAKVLARLRGRLKAVRFEDACRIARSLGFVHEGGKGSHRVFKREGEPLQLNFQDRDGCIPPYQARQLLLMVEKYGSEDEVSD